MNDKKQIVYTNKNQDERGKNKKKHREKSKSKYERLKYEPNIHL